MNLDFIRDLLNSIKRELFNFRFTATILFILATTGVLLYGQFTPKSYTSSAVLYADVSSILKPLLSGAAEVTDVERAEAARETLYSRSILEKVAIKNNLMASSGLQEDRDLVIEDLRKNIKLQISNNNHLHVNYTSGDPDRSFKVLSTLLDEFVKESMQSKRTESKGAYEFIDTQVQTYKRQLETAERKLKEFRASNPDGNSSDIQKRVRSLTDEIEELKLKIDETESRLELTNKQLENEGEFREITRSTGASELEQRIAQMHQRLDELRLKYHDTHPDIVNLRAQIEELEDRKAKGLDEDAGRKIVEVVPNPVYEELRVKQANAQSELQSMRNRLESLKQLLVSARERAEKVAERQAEETELMRDYDVTQKVYEEMLKRRENARLSMTLDVEGEGVNYRIQEPASYPTNWDGYQLIHYGAAGPVIGLGAVFGLLGALVMLDGRVRSSRMLREQLPDDIAVLASVPHYSSSFKSRLLRPDIMLIGLMLVLFLLAYAAVVVFSVLGYEPGDLINLLKEQLLD